MAFLAGRGNSVCPTKDFSADMSTVVVVPKIASSFERTNANSLTNNTVLALSMLSGSQLKLKRGAAGWNISEQSSYIFEETVIHRTHSKRNEASQTAVSDFCEAATLAVRAIFAPFITTIQ
jgi:hypothetical protein